MESKSVLRRLSVQAPEKLVERISRLQEALTELARWKASDRHNCWCNEAGPPHSQACNLAHEATTEEKT
jgi:hypothetical protein